MVPHPENKGAMITAGEFVQYVRETHNISTSELPFTAFVVVGDVSNLQTGASIGRLYGMPIPNVDKIVGSGFSSVIGEVWDLFVFNNGKQILTRSRRGFDANGSPDGTYDSLEIVPRNFTYDSSDIGTGLTYNSSFFANIVSGTGSFEGREGLLRLNGNIRLTDKFWGPAGALMGFAPGAGGDPVYYGNPIANLLDCIFILNIENSPTD